LISFGVFVGDDAPTVTSGWDDTDHSANVTVSGTYDEVATAAPAAGLSPVQSTKAQSAGVKSFAVTITGNGGANNSRAVVGLVKSTINLVSTGMSYPGQNGAQYSQSIGWWSDTAAKTIFENMDGYTEIVMSAGFINVVVGVVVDFTARTVKFYNNGSLVYTFTSGSAIAEMTACAAVSTGCIATLDTTASIDGATPWET
jgi:hypothetical protein